MQDQMSSEKIQTVAKQAADQGQMIRTVVSRRVERANGVSREINAQLQADLQVMQEQIQTASASLGLASAYSSYLRDAGERYILTLDALRQRSDNFLQHIADGTPPVLVYDSELVMDGKDQPHPCNYFLLRILPPEGMEIDNTKRPVVIIDPRAGHGPGIGGFKKDSQVGVALKDGSPVYFVAFRPMPEPGQTLAYVTEAEAAFLREVQRLHPEAPKPMVIGNCQGGWATAVLAATNPDLAGPIVLNGAPMSYWGGKLGQDPMRYSGGLAGGVTPALFAGDMGNGVFDGSNLVLNFEGLNPGRTWWDKYFSLYRNVDTGVEHFLEFERWWGGFFMMTTEEIQWIVENLFVGNKLGKNQAQLEPGRHIDLKAIRAPIICFASHGDNITPPAQALNWIMDTYADEKEIEIIGQRVLYMVHEQVGHLGIFVSSSVANKEHSQMANTLATIEALAPGLYEIKIDEVMGHGDDKQFKLSIAKRTFADITAETGDRGDEASFAPVARFSETLAELYDATLRPVVKQIVTEDMADLNRQTNVMRTSRAMFNSGNPGMSHVAHIAEQIKAARQPVGPENPFLTAEKIFGDMVLNAWDGLRDMREFMMETTFFSIWSTPQMLAYGAPRNVQRTKKDPKRLGDLPQVQMLMTRVTEGGLAEAIIRMLVLVAGTRSDLRHDRLERSMEVMHSRPPLSEMSVDARVTLIHEQTVIAHYAPEAALNSLPALLAGKPEREAAMDAVRYVVGAESEMAPETKAMIDQMATMLDVSKSSASAQTAAE
ncbi:MAG: DUF3141 domain-containing protein [Mangrovicoccus sp.]